MEYLDLYDKNRNLTGERIIRGSGKPDVPDGSYINIVIIFIRNDDGKFLIQKTSLSKGNVWATTGGHVKSLQTSREAIICEVYEELGIIISDSDFVLIDSSIFGVAIIDVYYMKMNIDIDDLVLQTEEVESVCWLSVSDINSFIRDNNFRKGNINGYRKVVDYLNNQC